MRTRSILGTAATWMLLVAANAAAQAPAKQLAPAAAAPAAKELTQLLRDFLAGASRNDAAMHDRFWADDLIYTSALGVRRGKAEIMSGLRAGTAPTQTAPPTVYTAEDIRIQQYGDTAIVAFRLVATPAATSSGPASGSASAAARSAPAKSGPPGQSSPQTATAAPAEIQRYFNTGTFLRRNGQWRVVAWQATRIP